MVEERRYIGNITQNINKLTKYMKEQNKNNFQFESFLHKLQKYLHKIRNVWNSPIKITKDQNAFTEQNVCVIQITNSVSEYNPPPLKSKRSNDDQFSQTSFSSKSKKTVPFSH